MATFFVTSILTLGLIAAGGTSQSAFAEVAKDESMFTYYDVQKSQNSWDWIGEQDNSFGYALPEFRFEGQFDASGSLQLLKLPQRPKVYWVLNGQAAQQALDAPPPPPTSIDVWPLQ
jgi:hypothetical protein